MSSPDQKPPRKETNPKVAVFGVLAFAVIWGIRALAIDGDTPAAEPAHTSVAAPRSAAPKSSSSKPSPAQMLADLDNNDHPAGDYQQVLNQFTPKCKEDEFTLASYVFATLTDLRKKHINDETELTVLQHLNDSLPDMGGKTECKQIAAAYLVLRAQ